MSSPPFGLLLLFSLLNLGLCLLQPVPHAHLAIHRRRGRKVLVRLLTLSRAAAELAEAEVAVADDGPI
jgi:hypothetical protein